MLVVRSLLSFMGYFMVDFVILSLWLFYLFYCVGVVGCV